MVMEYKQMRRRVLKFFLANWTAEEVMARDEFKYSMKSKTVNLWYDLFHIYGGEIPVLKKKSKDRFDPASGEHVLKMLQSTPWVHLREINDSLKEEGFLKTSLASIYRLC